MANRRGRTGVLMLALAWALPAAGEVYRCERPGGEVYTDKPCSAQAQAHALPAIGVMPGMDKPEADLARDYDEHSAKEQKAHAKADAAWLKEHQERKQEDAEFARAIRQKKVLKGMSADQVRLARGSPDEVERYDEGEQWLYGTGRSRDTVSFENGRVVGTGKAARR